MHAYNVRMTQMTTFFAMGIGKYDLTNKYLGQSEKFVWSLVAWSSKFQSINSFLCKFPDCYANRRH